MDPSCRELCVEFGDQVGSAVAEVAEGAVGATPFGERGVIEIFGADTRGVRDDRDHAVEPPAFTLRESAASLLLLSEPFSVSCPHTVSVGHELIVGAYGIAHQ